MTSNRLHISSSLSLPVDAVTQTFAILAKKRRGKTYTASVLAEEMIKAKLPFVALDPTGAWWGLRASADGKKAGYPVIIIGGEHGDIPITPESGAAIADLVIDLPNYYIIDLSQMNSNADQDRFATDFGERLYRAKAKRKFPMMLFVDEADCFVPQKPYPNQMRMLGAYDTIVRRGGIRGIGAEPLLGPMNIQKYLTGPVPAGNGSYRARLLDWVITGGESGPKARPGNPDWYRSLRDQCVAAGVAFHFKQWGEWAPWEFDSWEPNSVSHRVRIERRDQEPMMMYRVGKALAGRQLDARTWDEFPL